MNTSIEIEHQPLLPRISMRWYFVVAAITAVLASLIFNTSDPKAWYVTLFILLGATLFFFLLSAISFLLAFTFGALRRSLFTPQPTTESPFAHDTLPPQILPPAVRE